jgi:Ankyrin repeats (3 copies)/Ankyrin repeat
MYAAEDDHFKVAQFLLAKGADVNAKDNDGETALMKTPDYSLVIQVLLAKGADINAKKNNGETALIQASAVRRRSKVQMLLANGADVNAKDNDGMTALMGALMGAEKGIDCLDVVQTLIANGADVNAKDNERRPVLALATAFGFREVVETLRANGADVNAAAAAPALRGASAEQVAKINRLLDLGLRQSRDAARARRVLILKYLALVVAVPALLQYHMSPKPISSLLKLATLDQAWQSAQDIFNVTSEMVITAMAVLTITLGKSFDDAVWNFGCRLVGYFLAIAVLSFFVGSVFGLLLLLGREIVYWLGFQWIKGARVFDASPEKLATTSNPAAPVQPRGALAARLIQTRNWFRT